MAVDYTQRILAVAARSGGVCTRQALLDAGVGGGVIDRRLASGLLVRVRTGVYEAPLVVDDLTPIRRALAAVPRAVASRQTAAGLHRFPIGDGGLVHITAPNGAGRRLSGMVVHETRLMYDDDIVEVRPGLRATSPARTLFDLARPLSEVRLREVVRTQLTHERPTAVELQVCIASLARRGVPGLRKLRRVLASLALDVDPLPQSELEDRVWIGLQRHGMWGFRRQVRPPWFDGRRGIVDFAHEEAKVIIEADGRRWHAAEKAMAVDRQRDRVAVEHGWVVVRVMWHEIVHRPELVFGELQRIVNRRLGHDVLGN
jgi:very-short-patch-repair endonuclease